MKLKTSIFHVHRHGSRHRESQSLHHHGSRNLHLWKMRNNCLRNGWKSGRYYGLWSARYYGW